MPALPNFLRTVALCGVVVGLLAPTASAQQLLQNPSCERTTAEDDDGTNDAADWTETDPDDPANDWACKNVTYASPQDGDRYFVMEVEDEPTGYTFNLQQDISTGVDGGATYSFSGLLFTADSDVARVHVQYLDSEGSQIDEFDTGFITTGGSWERKRDTREAPSSTTTIRVKLQVEETDGSTTNVKAYFDDLKLTEKPKVQITEVMQNPSVGDGEYVELYNSTVSSINIDGWTLNDSDSDLGISGVEIPARDFVVLCRNSSADQNGGLRACDDELSSMSLGDDTGTITLKDGSGSTIDEISYDTGGNWPDVSGAAMVFTAATGTNTGSNWAAASRRERGFALDQSGDDGSPGRNGTDQTLQPTAKVASGSAGWQMLSAPVSGVNVDTLAQANLVQGFSGHFPDDALNLYQWPGGKKGNNVWTKPSSPTTDLTSDGAGFIWYVFGSTGTALTDTPPFTMSVPGTVRTTDVTTSSLSGGDGNSAFHLLGNPYGESFDPSGLDLRANNFQTTVQVWDPSSESYDVVMLSPDESDLLSAYQGFFVEKETGGSATLTFSASSRSSTSASLKRLQEPDPRIGFRLVGRGAEGDTLTQDRALTLRARSDASMGWDLHDASKLTPIAGQYATAAFQGARDGDTVQKAVTSVPVPLPEDSIGVPIRLRTSGAGAVENFTLTWPDWTQVPDDWQVLLRDTSADTTINLRTQSSYTFATETGTSRQSSDAPHSSSPIPTPRPPGSPMSAPAKATADTSRFVLTIQSGAIPVELTQVGATLSGRRASIEWTTASETRNAGFYVEHQAPESREFATLGFVEGSGTTQTPQTYRYRTDPLDPGHHAFRLRQVDTDGTEHASRTVDATVGLDRPYAVSVQPHPVTSNSAVELTVRRQQRVRVDVYDLLGRRVGTLSNESFPANETRQIPLRPGEIGLTSGTYFLRIDGDAFTGTERFVVVR